MITIVCVYNKREIFDNILMRSLKRQTIQFETIFIDNQDNHFKSAAAALNNVGSKANGDYILFAHQDMWIGPDSWFEEIEEILNKIPDLGIAGVAGMSEHGTTREERCQWAIFRETPSSKGAVQKPVEVQTLDECLLIIPKKMFQKLKFDEKNFDGWHCYGADYCLSVKRLGLKAYVIPGDCSHSCLNAKNPEFEGLIEYEKRLFLKHNKSHSEIYTWMGIINWKKVRFHGITQKLESFLDFLNRYMNLFPDFLNVTREELLGCNKILDLGCGYLSPIQYLKKDLLVGVDIFEPNLIESKKMMIHDQYLKADIANLEFKPKCFDAVLLYSVLENLTKSDGGVLLEKIEKWAKKKIIIYTPNGFSRRYLYNFNPFLRVKSAWKAEELENLGYKVSGFNGWKKLRNNNGEIKYPPAYLIGLFSIFTEKIAHKYPKLAYHLCAIKDLTIK